MISRWVVHIEAHYGRWPVLRVQRAPRPGDVITDGSARCVLTRCDTCSGGGLLAQELVTPA